MTMYKGFTVMNKLKQPRGFKYSNEWMNNESSLWGIQFSREF